MIVDLLMQKNAKASIVKNTEFFKCLARWWRHFINNQSAA
ncbi:hypothetical protein ACINWC743_2393 [Acinetobacter sp. WC-743]|nr:hypothetical protein ACINWC743_2393 [Acinetobacter sp. WC-743]